MTRKMTLLVLSVVLSISGGYAQQIYKKFRVDVGGGWGYSFRKGGGGLIVTMEPRYAITDKLSLGLHYAAVARVKMLRAKKPLWLPVLICLPEIIISRSQTFVHL